jgi:hypothetical protein
MTRASIGPDVPMTNKLKDRLEKPEGSRRAALTAIKGIAITAYNPTMKTMNRSPMFANTVSSPGA